MSEIENRFYREPNEREQSDSICEEHDGCPTEKAVLQRYWRSHQGKSPESDALMVLELLAAEADAGTVMIPSGLRLTIDAALIKAGRKAAPTAVRHVTIAGVRDE